MFWLLTLSFFLNISLHAWNSYLQAHKFFCCLFLFFLSLCAHTIEWFGGFLTLAKCPSPASVLIIWYFRFPVLLCCQGISQTWLMNQWAAWLSPVVFVSFYLFKDWFQVSYSPNQALVTFHKSLVWARAMNPPLVHVWRSTLTLFTLWQLTSCSLPLTFGLRAH